MNTIRFTDMAVIDAMPPEYREGQIILLEMELIVAQKLIAVNEHRLHRIDESSLTNTTIIRQTRKAECNAALFEEKLLRYLRRPPKGQYRGAINLEDPHFTTWMHCYMLTDFDTPLIDPNCVPLDTRGEIVDVHSLPIRRPDQSSLRAVLAKLQELLIPPNHPINRMMPYERHIERVWHESNGAVCDIYSNPSYDSFTSARKFIVEHIGWLQAAVYFKLMSIESYAKTVDGLILVDRPERFSELLSKRQMRDMIANGGGGALGVDDESLE